MVDLSDTKLVQYGVTDAWISDAFQWLLQKPSVDLCDDVLGCEHFHRLAAGVVNFNTRYDSTSGVGPTPTKPTTSADISMRRDMLAISSNPGDNTAMAAAGILVTRTREKILE